MANFDFDVEIEEFLNEGKKEQEKKKAAFPDIRIKQRKAQVISETTEEKIGEAAKQAIVEPEEKQETLIFTLRTTANREDQVMDFISANVVKKKLEVYSAVRPHGMRGYIFIEAKTQSDAEQAAHGIPYARGILAHPVPFKEIEHMFEQAPTQVNIRKNDIVEIISGPFKREKAKVTRIDPVKEDVVVELLESAVPIPMTLKLDAVRVIRREEEEK